MVVEKISTSAGVEDAMALRYRVFCDEQHVPREIERDEADAFATHLVIREAGAVVATGRVLRQRTDGTLVALASEARPGDTARIGRMAVAPTHRRNGLGLRILQTLESEALSSGLVDALLHAQLHAAGFYEKAGYSRHGPEFVEAGIPHVEMTRRLP